jgi:hypothetical protein
LVVSHLLVAWLLAACGLGSAPATVTPVSTVPVLQASATPPPTLEPSPTATATPAPTPTQFAPCEMRPTRRLPVYHRPGAGSAVFGYMAAGMVFEIAGRTDDGWLGFEPGFAEMAGSGIFRLVWVRAGESMRLAGDCEHLPRLVGPLVGVCYSQAAGEVPVYAEPDTSSQVVSILGAEDLAAATGRAPGGWVQVDLANGDTGLALVGWMVEGALSLSGPCERLPVVVP